MVEVIVLKIVIGGGARCIFAFRAPAADVERRECGTSRRTRTAADVSRPDVERRG
ncbi:MAG: hypothetical protein HY867_04365 [Chloroflexi bacterium]|nr:hypothetical protein [Chloroflexota bacterium]